jgi:hypothetical protein
LPEYKLYFADLHFHTHYSDNRDFASIERMILHGQKKCITIFGVGDHNHSLDLKKWKQSTEESAILREKYPFLNILINCEITFLFGHFLVLAPNSISGTIEEGYDLLYKSPDVIKIINHPNPDTDEWYRRIIPSVAGVEVINGALFLQAKKVGYPIQSALDIPFVQTFARYLSLGYPVAAIGNSDAHEVSETGSGLTGLWLSNPQDKAQVLDAVRERRCFATTDPGIRLYCALDRKQELFSWTVEWNPINESTAVNYTVEIFNRDKRLEFLSAEGQVKAEKHGMYWVAAFNHEAIAISSPVCLLKTRHGSYSPGRIFPVAALYNESIKDLTWLRLRKQESFNLAPVRKHGQTQIELLSMNPNPEITDAECSKVEYSILKPGKEQVVIKKRCLSPCFDEFFLWLERNEVHECVFLEVDYKKARDIFIFKGLIVPAKMVVGENVRNWYQDEIPRIRSQIDSRTKFLLDVRTPFRSSIQVSLHDHSFPWEIDKGKTEVRNLLLWSDLDPDERDLCLFLNVRSVNVGAWDPGQRIFQFFIPSKGHLDPGDDQDSRGHHSTDSSRPC